MSSIFAKIVNDEIPSFKVHEDKHHLAFLDINPVVGGHILLIPKEHHKNMEETPDELVSKLFRDAKMLMPKIRESMAADYIAISVVGTDVPHFHIHLVPRKFDDGLAETWPTKKYPDGESVKIGNKIKEAFD